MAGKVATTRTRTPYCPGIASNSDRRPPQSSNRSGSSRNTTDTQIFLFWRMPLAPRMVIEIDVGVQVLTIQVSMRAAAGVFGIVQQVRIPGVRYDERKKLRCCGSSVERGGKAPIEARSRGEDGFRSSLFGRKRLGSRHALGVEVAGNLGHQLAAEFGLQKLVNHDMPNGRLEVNSSRSTRQCDRDAKH